MNNLNFAEAKYFGKPGSTEILLKDIDKIDASIREQLETAGDRGCGLWLKEGEEIVFPSKKDAKIFLDKITISNNETRPSLSIGAYCERLGFFHFSLSVFRRIPIQECLEGQEKSDFEVLTEDNEFGLSLMTKQTDFSRILRILGKTVKVSQKLRLHTYDFGINADGKYVRLETTRPLTCYKFSVAE